VNGARKLHDFWAAAMTLGTSPSARLSIFWRETKNVRVRLGLARHHPNRIYSLDTVFGRLHFRDNFGDITNLPDLLHREVYRTKAAVGAGVILDVGANIGLAAAWFSRQYPGRPIHCFEPLVENARLIPLNCPGATVRQVAVGRARGAVDLAVDADGVMASTIPYGRAAATRRLDVIALDDYAAEQGFDRVALLKIDTEGMELDVLEGARRVLDVTGVVAMETHGAERHSETIRILQAAGLQLDREEFDRTTGLVFASRSTRPIAVEQAPGTRTTAELSSRAGLRSAG
jgi:FkbM family methyltransferase